MGETFDSNTWLLVASSVLLFLGGLSNLFCLAAVKNSAKAEASQPYKAYVRHTKYLQHAVDAFLNFFTILLIHLPWLGDIYPCDIYPWRHIPMRHLPIGDIYPWPLSDLSFLWTITHRRHLSDI